MTITIATEKVGSRIYVCGNTFAIKSQLKDAGCHWDGDRKQWWIGAAKAASIASIVGQLYGKTIEPAKSELADRPCTGKVEYKGRTYYVIGHSEKTAKLWLTVLDCSIDFWAAVSECKIIKRYESREDYRTGRTAHQTVGGIRRFIDKSKRDEATVKSGEMPDGWCIDLEDGCAKPRHQCDMPSEKSAGFITPFGV